MTATIESQNRFIPSVQPRGIRPGAPAVYTVYQLVLKIDSRTAGAGQAFDSAVQQTLAWAQVKFPEKLPEAAGPKQRFKCEVPGQRVSCARHDDFWAVRLEQPDSPFGGRPAIGGRTWTTDISIAQSEKGLFFGIKVICASLPGCNDEIFLTRPGVVRDVADDTGLMDCIKITPKPIVIGQDIAIDDFYNLVTDPGRSLPVLVLSQLSQADRERLPVQNVLPYVVDEKYLAEKIFGYAHVMLMPWGESFNWTSRVGKAWSVFNGAVRVYHTGLNFETNPLYCHPLTLLDQIIFWNEPGSKEIAERAFTSFLINSIQTNSTARRIDWSKNPFVNDIELMIEQAEQKSLAYYLENSKSSQETLAILKSQKESQDREIELLKKSIREKDNETAEYLDLTTMAERDKSYFEDENKKLRAHISGLRIQLEKKQKQKIDDTIKIPETLEDLPEWVSEHLIGRVVLHPRAFQGIKKSVYKNPPLVYRALLLLANQYRNMRLSQIKQEDYFKSRDELQLRDGPSIDKDHAPEYGSTYYVQFPIGSTVKRFLELHLRCGGNTRDPERCLAVYFFWDDETQQVVIGWLPGHLENMLT